MFAQLGNTKYELLKGFDSWSNGGGDAIYGEHEVIGGKSRLQKTGDDLKELSFTIKLRANYCNPSVELASLETSKVNGEILSLLLGDGTYIGDYVIISTANTIDEAFENGTPIQITVNLTIKEFAAFSKLELQQQEARRKALSVGAKAPVTRQIPQNYTPAATASQMVTKATEQTNAIDAMALQYKNNESQRTALQRNIENACEKAKGHLDDLNKHLQNADDLNDKYNSIGDAATDVKTKVNAVKNAFPLQNIDNLQDANTILQGSVLQFKSSAIPLQKSVITRKQP